VLPKEWQSVRRVLAVQLGNLREVMQLSPALGQLKQALPDATIVLLCAPESSAIALLSPWVDEVLMHKALVADESGKLFYDPHSILALIEMLRSENFDAAILFAHDCQSPYPFGYLCYLAGIPIRVGMSQEFGGGVLSHWVKPGGTGTARNLFLLASIGLVPTQEIEPCSTSGGL
jgi:ADP-heptose:LPS heptosyltransferase